MATATQLGVCKGLDLAKDAVKSHGRLSRLEIGASLQLGGFFALPLPDKVTDAQRTTDALFELAMENDPRELDTPPVVKTAFGVLPVIWEERCKLLVDLAQRPQDERAVKLRRAAVELEDYMHWLHQTWDARRHEVWEALRDTELLASERFYQYLMANLEVVERERERYQNDDNVFQLWKASARIHRARKNWKVDDLKTAAAVVDGVALCILIGAIGESVLLRNDLTIDDNRARRQIAAAAGLQQEAHRQLMEGVTEYLTTLRKEAEYFPVLLVLDHRYELLAAGAKQTILKRLDAAETAIGNLSRTGVNATAVPEVRVARLADMAERIANGPRCCVWKLPFFIDQALEDMPQREANAVRRMRKFAAEVESGDAIQNGIVLGSVEIAMLVAAFTGPVGVGVAFMWAVTRLSRTVHEYGQLRDLFAASLDPAALLLDTEHDPASKMWIFLDMLGLLV